MDLGISSSLISDDLFSAMTVVVFSSAIKKKAQIKLSKISNEMVSSPEFGDPADANVSTDISADAIVRILTSALLSTDTTFFLCSNWF